MAIRFIDLGRQLDPGGPRMFALYDPALGAFARLGDRIAWPDWAAFEGSHREEYRRSGARLRVALGAGLAEIRAICPAWVADHSTEPYA